MENPNGILRGDSQNLRYIDFPVDEDGYPTEPIELPRPIGFWKAVLAFVAVVACDALAAAAGTAAAGAACAAILAVTPTPPPPPGS
jgi:hypothetical protein